jgi:hypothetical protein
MRAGLAALVSMASIAAVAGLAAEPVQLESRVDANGNGEAIVSNRGNVPLTAWIFEIVLEPCNPAQTREQQTGGYDAALTTPPGKPLAPGSSMTQNIGAAHCNKDGVNIPATARLRAAVFADGSTYGEKAWVVRLLRERQLKMRK